jgi:hypothetical protein
MAVSLVVQNQNHAVLRKVTTVFGGWAVSLWNFPTMKGF